MHRSYRTLLLQGAASLLLASAVLGAWCGEGRAADVTPAQAAALEAQLTEAMSGLLGIQVAGPVKITAAGDHFDLVAPTIYRSVDGAKPIDATAQARQLPDGTWSVDHVMMQTPLRITLNMPDPAAPPSTPAKTIPMAYTIDLKGQDGTILWDPSFAKPSTFASSVQGVTVHTDAGPMTQDSTIGPIKSLTTLRPAAPGRVDVLLDGTIDDYHIQATTDNGPLQMLMKHVTVKSALDGVSREKAVFILRTLVGIGTAAINAPAPAGQPRPAPKVAPETIRLLLGALQDFASDFSLDETLDGMTVNAQGQNVAIDQVKLGMAAKSTAGMLDAGMDIGVQGLALPDLPLGDMAVLIPKRVALHPVISGIGVAELMRIATAASENHDPAPADIMALFSHGGITGGLDSMTVDVAGAIFTGSGKVVATAPSPDALTGTAHIEAAGLDGLIQKISTMPALAQAIPVLALAKGLGKVVDNHVVWDLTYQNGKVLVNNVDLTAMGGARSPAPPDVAPPPVPQTRPNGPAMGGGVGGARKAPTPNQMPSWGR